MTDLEHHFPKLLALTANIAREWFHEVETSIPPNSDDRISSASGIRHNVDDLDRDNAASPSVVTMQMLCRVALGDDEDGRVSSSALHVPQRIVIRATQIPEDLARQESRGIADNKTLSISVLRDDRHAETVDSVRGPGSGPVGR